MMQDLDRVQPRFSYYRQPNGWITCAVNTELEEMKYRKEGWEPLLQYGRFDMANEYGANHPLEWLFQQGGAKELPLDQVIEMGLYYNLEPVPTCGLPVYQYHARHLARCWVNAKPVEFPQLEGMEIEGPFSCRFCDEKKPTTRARDQHESVAHKTEKGDVRTGEVLANALLRGGMQAAATPAPPIFQVTEPETLAEKAMKALSGVGLTKKQRDALEAAGIPLEETDDPN